MAEIKGNLISELPSTTLDGTEQIPVEKNGANNSVTVNEVKEFVKQSIPSGGTSDYNQLQNKPSINNVELNGNVDINADTIKVKYSPTGNPFEEEQVSLSQTVGSVSGRLSRIQNEAGQCTSKINTLEDETIPSIGQEIASLGTQIPTNVSELTNDSDFATNAQVQQKIAEAQLSGGGGTAINEVEINDTGIAPEDPNVELWVDMTDDSPIPTEQKNEVEVSDSGVEPTDPNTEIWVDLSEQSNSEQIEYTTEVNLINSIQFGGLDINFKPIDMKLFMKYKRTGLLVIDDCLSYKITNNNSDLDLTFMIYGADFKPIGQIISVKSNNITNKTDFPSGASYAMIVMRKKSIGETRLDVDDVKLEVTTLGKKYTSRIAKFPYIEGQFEIGFSYKSVFGGYASYDVTNIADPVRYSENWEFTNGKLILPRNYSSDGTPVRLIIYVPGSADLYGSFGNYLPYAQYLADEGYAVAVCKAWGNIATENGMTNCDATPSNYAAYHALVNYLYDNFNITKGFFAWSKSQGGLMTLALANDPTFDLLAACALCGTISPLCTIYGMGRGRMAALKDMGFSGLEQDEQGNYIGEGACMLDVEGAEVNEWTSERKTYWLKNVDRIRDPFFQTLTNLKYEDYFFKLFENNRAPDKINSWKQLNPHNVILKPYLIMGSTTDTNVRNQPELLWAGCHHNQNTCSFMYVTTRSHAHHGVDTDGIMLTVKTKYGKEVAEVPTAYATMLDFFRHYE